MEGASDDSPSVLESILETCTVSSEPSDEERNRRESFSSSNLKSELGTRFDSTRKAGAC